jgi:signal transduction histidine kinase
MQLLLLTSEAAVPAALASACSARGDEIRCAPDLDAARRAHTTLPCDVILVGTCPRESDAAMTEFLLGAREGGASIVLLADDPDNIVDCADDFLVLPLTAPVVSARLTILERHRQEWAHKRAILMALPDLMFRMDEHGRYLECHAADPRLLFAPDLVGKTINETLPADVAELCMAKIEEIIETGAPSSFEYTLPLPDAPHRFEARLVACGNREVLSIVRDVTSQYHALDVKQRFASRVITAQETERQHLSRELHDVVGQIVLVHRMDADFIARHPTASDEVRAAANSLGESLDSTLQMVRTMALGLRPPALDDLGLGCALETLVGELSTKSGIHGECDISPEVSSICSETAVALYRIAQEALSNAVRHGAGSRLTLTLGRVNGDILLSVEDDGVGISEDSANDSSSLGLLSMRERAELFGGHVEIKRANVRGTVVAVSIPDTQHHRSPN